MADEIINDRWPDDKDHAKPEESFPLVTEGAEKNVSQDNEHKPDIHSKTDQAGGEKAVELAKVGEEDNAGNKGNTILTAA